MVTSFVALVQNAAGGLRLPEWLVIALFGALLGAVGWAFQMLAGLRDQVREHEQLLQGTGKHLGLVEQAEKAFERLDTASRRLEGVCGTVKNLEERFDEREVAMEARFNVQMAELKRLFQENNLRWKRRP